MAETGGHLGDLMAARVAGRHHSQRRGTIAAGCPCPAGRTQRRAGGGDDGGRAHRRRPAPRLAATAVTIAAKASTLMYGSRSDERRRTATPRAVPVTGGRQRPVGRPAERSVGLVEPHHVQPQVTMFT